MGKNKLKKFAEMATFSHQFDFNYQSVLKNEPLPLKGAWREVFFKNNNPIVLELGCGKGEYTVGLAERYPDKNFIGIDIKGSRMWTGAKMALEKGLTNVAFLRTGINLSEHCFGPNEVDEIWITFADPQMKKPNKRLTSTAFLNIYGKFLSDDCVIHLKTDSKFLYTYTLELVKHNNLPIISAVEDIYSQQELLKDLDIKTYYEQQWIARGLEINYLSFNLSKNMQLDEPNVEIEYDLYRSFGRQKRTELQLGV